MDPKTDAKLREIRASLERLDLDGLSGPARWVAFMDWIQQSKGAGWYLIDLVLDQTSPLSREDRRELDNKLKACLHVLSNAVAEIEHVRQLLVGKYDEEDLEVITSDIDDANTGDILSDEASQSIDIARKGDE